MYVLPTSSAASQPGANPKILDFRLVLKRSIEVLPTFKQILNTARSFHEICRARQMGRRSRTWISAWERTDCCLWIVCCC